MPNRNSLSIITLEHDRPHSVEVVTAITLGAVNDWRTGHVTLAVHDMDEVKAIVGGTFPEGTDHVLDLRPKLTVVTYDAFTWAMVSDLFILVDPHMGTMMDAPVGGVHSLLVMDDDGGLTLMSMVSAFTVDITDISAGL
jgi:hypothetical protein